MSLREHFPRSLFWKEMRQIRLLVPVFVCQVMCYAGAALLALLNHQFPYETHVPIEVFLGAGVALAGLLGCLFFSTELEAGTGSFLFRFPVERRAIAGAKMLAGLTTMVIIVLYSFLLFCGVAAIWGPVQGIALGFLGRGGGEAALSLTTPYGLGYVPCYLALAVAFYFVAALVSLRVANPLLAFLLSGVATALVAPVLIGLASSIQTLFGGFLHAETKDIFFPAYCIVAVLAAVRLWGAFGSMEERATDARLKVAGRLSTGAGLLNLAPDRLWRVEAREKRLPLLALTALFVLLLIWSKDTMPILFVVAGITMGIMMFSSSERDGAGFFLHFLPISRSRIFFQRLTTGLLGCVLPLVAFGLVFLIYYVVLVYAQRDTGNVDKAMETTRRWLGLFGSFYVIAFLTSAMFSPLARTTLTGVFYSFLALLLPEALSLAMYPPRYATLYSQIPYVAFLCVAAWWVTVRSRAFEPGIGKDRRAIILIGCFWAFAIAVNLVDPMDLLYLMTGYQG